MRECVGNNDGTLNPDWCLEHQRSVWLCVRDMNLQVADLRRLMGHWSTVELALKAQEAVKLQNEAMRMALEKIRVGLPGHQDWWTYRVIAEEALTEKPNRDGLCTNDRDGEKCLKRAGHEGICEGPKNVWDWRPTYSTKPKNVCQQMRSDGLHCWLDLADGSCPTHGVVDNRNDDKPHPKCWSPASEGDSFSADGAAYRFEGGRWVKLVKPPQKQRDTIGDPPKNPNWSVDIGD